MAAFTIGRDKEGRRIWWVNYQNPGMTTPDMREPTEEEALIMERIEACIDVPGDSERLNDLLQHS